MRHKFDDIVFNSKAKKIPTETDKYTYIGLEHLDSGSLTVTRFGSEVAPISEKLLMRKGDVLFGKRRAYQKKVAIAPFDGIFSAHGMVLRPKEKVIDKNFFPLFISSDYFLDAAIKISVGSLSPTINWGELKELEFDLPTLEDQRALANVLWAMTDAKNAYISLIKQTEQLVKAQFVELFGDLEKNDRKWAVLRLDEVSVLNMGQSPDSKSYNQDGDGLPFFQGNADFGEVNPVTRVWCTQPTKIAEQGDILISVRAPIGMLNFASEKCCIGRGLAAITAKADMLSSDYLFFVLSEKTSDLLAKGTGTTFLAINKKAIADTSIMLPPLDLQNQFADFMRQADKSKSELGRTLAELEASYKALLREKLG
jgi:type I restriction enzyme S subunit